MPRIYHALWISLFITLALPSKTNAQCAPPSYAETRYVYPYRAWLGLNMPNGATGSEAEAVPQGQAFSGIPNASGDASGLFILYNLEPNTVYDWRARAKCSNGSFSNWSATYTLSTPAPCPAAPLAPLDSVINLTFPAGQHPNVGYSLCGQETEFSNGTYVWGLELRILATKMIKNIKLLMEK